MTGNILILNPVFHKKRDNMVEKRILIWGTGEKADCAWNDLIKYSHIRIVAFGDNDEKKEKI